MPAILKTDFSVINAENFVDSFVNGNSNIFLAVGRSEDEWADETLPPTPTDTIASEVDMRNNIIGIKRVLVTGIMIMVPRIEWKAGLTFNIISDSAVSGKRATDYFCITSNNDVYQCILAPGNVTAEGAEPTAHAAEVSTADGYKWKYLYTVTAAMVNNGMLLDNWMPVPFNKHGEYPGGTLTDSQYLQGDVNSNRILGAYRVLVTATLGNEGDTIPYSITYRQVALLVDPTDNDGTRLEGDLYAKSEFDYLSGEMIYFENRRPVAREESQKETMSLLIIF